MGVKYLSLLFVFKKSTLILFLALFSVLFVYNIEAQQTGGVCCVDSGGYCSPNVDASNCVTSSLGSGSCYNPDGTSKYNQCAIMGCVFPSGCILTNQARCTILNGKPNANIITEEQCQVAFSSRTSVGTGRSGTSPTQNQQQIPKSCHVPSLRCRNGLDR